jgi:hypothetical protein
MAEGMARVAALATHVHQRHVPVAPVGRLSYWMPAGSVLTVLARAAGGSMCLICRTLSWEATGLISGSHGEGLLDNWPALLEDWPALPENGKVLNLTFPHAYA